jgi:type IV pilus assembly protein PilB
MLRFRLSVDIDPRLAAKSAIKKYVEGAAAGTQRTFAANQSLVTDSIDKSVDRSVDRSVDKSMDKSIDVAVDDAPIVKLCNRILSEAVRMRASDIHIEPMAIACVCGIASTACAWSVTTCPSACRTRCSAASS